MSKKRILLAFLSFIILFQGFHIQAQEVRKRLETLNLICKEKLDIILPKAMRENNIDMWIIVNKFGHSDPLSEDVGGGGPSDKWSHGEFLGYLVFTDRGGDRIERAALGARGNRSLYDIFGETKDLRKFVAERDPKRIAVNMSEKVGVADGLSYTCYLSLIKDLGEKYVKRLVSAEKLVCEFRSQRVLSEVVAFANACELTRKIEDRALSNEVITPGVTTLADVAWWLKEQHWAYGLGSTLRLPAVFIRYPEDPYGSEITSNDYHIIQGGDLVQIDWGVRMMNFSTDIKRIAYVLREGETAVPPDIQNAFEAALKARDIMRKNIKPGRTGAETIEILYRKLEEAGFVRMEHEDQMTDLDHIEVNIGMHSVGNQGHGAGPAIWAEKPFRHELEIKPTNFLAFEFMLYFPVPGWKRGKKRYIAIEEDVIITENGVECPYPMIERILLIR